MFFPEQHVGGLWDIEEHDKQSTTVDKSNRKAFTPKDMTPIYELIDSPLFKSSNYDITIEQIIGTKCDMRTKECTDEGTLCKHKTYAVKILLDKETYDRYQGWYVGYTNYENYTTWFRPEYYDLLKDAKHFGLDVVASEPQKGYIYSSEPIVKLGLQTTDKILTLDYLRNASAYLDLQKEMPKIRKFDGFTELDWDSVFNLLRHIHLTRKYWWYSDELTNLSNTSLQIILSKLAVMLANPSEDALPELYYELVNSVFKLKDLTDVIRRAEYSIRELNNHTYKHDTIKAVIMGEVREISFGEFVLKAMLSSATKVDETVMIRQKLEALRYALQEAMRAQGHINEGMWKYGKITTNRLKKAARTLHYGGNYVKQRASKLSVSTVSTSWEEMSKLMDDKSKKLMAERLMAKDHAKFLKEFKMFHTKYMNTGTFQTISGGKPTPSDAAYGGTLRWGDLSIINEPLTKNLKYKIKGAIHKPNEYGVIPHYTDRYFSDKRMFRVKKNIKGGTVLIDASGSMSLSEQDIFDIINALPASTVAMYSGTSQNKHVRGNADGELCIIAKNKRMVGKLPETLGENIVDYPALLWLSKMPRPRIWVSDGEVTMLHMTDGTEEVTRDGKEQCNTLIKRAGIITLEDIGDVIDFAKSMKRY